MVNIADSVFTSKFLAVNCGQACALQSGPACFVHATQDPSNFSYLLCFMSSSFQRLKLRHAS